MTLLAEVQRRQGDETETVERQGVSNESNQAPIEDDCETIPDEELVLRLESISCAKRCGGTWMFKVKYKDSLLAREFFGQLLFGDAVLSRLAKEAQFEETCCRVQWWPEWVPIWGMVLTRPYDELVKRLDAQISIDDDVRWEAIDSAYTVSGTSWSHHLCLSEHCAECAENDVLSSSANS